MHLKNISVAGVQDLHLAFMERSKFVSQMSLGTARNGELEDVSDWEKITQKWARIGN